MGAMRARMRARGTGPSPTPIPTSAKGRGSPPTCVHLTGTLMGPWVRGRAPLAACTCPAAPAPLRTTHMTPTLCPSVTAPVIIRATPTRVNASEAPHPTPTRQPCSRESQWIMGLPRLRWGG
jgi:hypothetical protein